MRLRAGEEREQPRVRALDRASLGPEVALELTLVELAEGKGSEAAIEKAHQRRRAAEYKKILDQIKGQAVIASELLNT